MRIVELRSSLIRLPLKKEIRHASHARRESVNLLVSCRLADGTEGWGEGVPREYVTGETPGGTQEQLAATLLGEQLARDCDNWEDVIAMCDSFRPAPVREDPRGCYGNALRCAVELSVLDAFGRLFGEPLSTVTHRYEPARELRAGNETVCYSGVITAERPAGEVLSALKIRLYGFAQCKVKVGTAGIDESRRLGRLRRWLGRNMDLRLDANEAWRASEVIERVEPLLKYHVSSIEQPVPHAEVDSLPEIRRRLDVPIMLDESLTSEIDANRAIESESCDLLNIRLSKCGGFLSSLRLAAMARAAGLGYQLGCHPGESGILSAAGRHWAASVGGIRYLEGSYDRHVLRELPTNEDVTFGYGGKAKALTAPGLGVTVNPATLARYASGEQVFRLD